MGRAYRSGSPAFRKPSRNCSRSATRWCRTDAAQVTPDLGKTAFILPFYNLHLRLENGGGMRKPFAVGALCVISAALGAAIDHYLAGEIEQGGPRLEGAVSPKAAVAAPVETNVPGTYR